MCKCANALDRALLSNSEFEYGLGEQFISPVASKALVNWYFGKLVHFRICTLKTVSQSNLHLPARLQIRTGNKCFR